MKIKLTKNQIVLIQKRLEANELEEKELRIKQNTEHVSGWDFAELSNERHTLKELIKTGEVDTVNYL